MADRTPSRRDFLRGRAALGAAANAISDTLEIILPSADEGKALSGVTKPTVQNKDRVLVLARRAMACLFELRLSATEEYNPTEAGMHALDLIEQIETQLTVYRETSELIELNQRAFHEPIELEPKLFELLQIADKLWKQTNGAFDITCGPLSRVWGFSQREGRVPEPNKLDEARSQVGWQHVELDPATKTVRFEQLGTEINLNSIGKGYALDRAAALLEMWDVSDSLLHGGGSTLLAQGNHHALEKGGWLAGIRDPFNPQRRLAEISLLNEALSSSGNGTQFFEYEGRRYGHLIDPRTGMPTDGLLMATAVAPTAAEADALSTAFFLLGLEGTQRYCGEHPEVGALLLAYDPQDSEKTLLETYNLGDRDCRFA